MLKSAFYITYIIIVLNSSLVSAAIVGEESADIVSDNPDTEEAKNAEARGYGLTCGIDVGSLNLVRYKSAFYLIGTSHGFYKKGQLSCTELNGLYYPFEHYGSNDGINEKQAFKFLLPPLNHNQALRNKTHVLSTENLRDFVILKIEKDQIPIRKPGEITKFFKLGNLSFNEIRTIADERRLSIISGRKNYHNFKYVGIEKGCRVYPVVHYLEIRKHPIFRHDCDTGSGSSGSFLFFEEDDQMIAIGMHYGTLRDKGEHIQHSVFRDGQNTRGNYFISTRVIIDYIERHILNASGQ